MKKLYLLPFLTVSLVSCYTYQYMTVNSTQMLKNKSNEFVVENDSFRLVYNFLGLDVPINITLENKLDRPVTIDWRQSALVINNQAISYVADKVPITGNFNGSTFQVPVSHAPNAPAHATGSQYASTSGNLSATATLPAHMDFLPPHTYVTKTPLGVTNQFYELPEARVRREPVLLFDGSTRKMKVMDYTEGNSPLKFRSFVTVVLGDSPGEKITYEHSFYISEILETATEPQVLQFMNKKPGNKAYVRKTSGFGVGFGIIAGTALITAAAMASHGQPNQP
jgi:hypothetical protein